MGLYKRSGTEHWWCRFQIAGREYKRSTRTSDRRAAQVEERRLRAYYESKAPRRRAAGAPRLADLGGLDVQRAAAAGATPAHIEALAWQWERIVTHFGADAELPKVYETTALEGYVVARRNAGATDTVRREMQALRRAEDIAHGKGWLPFKLDRWPKLGDTTAHTSKRRGRVHPPSVVRAWLDALRGEARDAAEVVLVTWLRDAELHRVCESWIEPAPDGSGLAAVLRVPPHASKTKRTRRERIRGLDKVAAAALARRIEAAKKRAAQNGEPYTIETPLFRSKSYKTAFRLARERIKYLVPISLRDLRKTGATWAQQRVGIDAARDGLGHSNIATTHRYIGADETRALAGSAAVSEALGRHSKTGTGRKMRRMERAKGLEPSTLSLGSQLPTLLDHVTACKHCAERVAACSKITVFDGVVGTGTPAQSAVQLRPVRFAFAGGAA